MKYREYLHLPPVATTTPCASLLQRGVGAVCEAASDRHPGDVRKTLFDVHARSNLNSLTGGKDEGETFT